MRVLDIITGLLLLGVVLALLYVVTRVLLWRHVTALFSRVAADENKPVNSHLVGTTGQLLAAGDGLPEGRVRVRIGMERWDAIWSGDAPDAPAPGSDVRVVAIDGMTLLVVPADSESTTHQLQHESSDHPEPQNDRAGGEPPLTDGEAIRT
jgi:membrane protein implicated in regulation of membrane protease activity